MSKRALVPSLLLALLVSSLPVTARAHCDTLDGPVVVAARAALETGKLEPVLAWIQPADEAEVKATFTRARAVRTLGAQARDLADTAFFETVVRLHRAGEGAPYTGLKAAGQELGPAVPAADRAIARRTPAEVEALLVGAVRKGLHERLHPVLSLPPPGQDVAAGRAWVAAYVPYVHWVEGVHQAATAGAGHHAEAAAEARGHAEAAPAHGHE